MKYSQTARVLSLIFHGIIALAFGCLGFYLGFFVVPEYFNAGANIFVDSLFRASYLLYFELAAVGLTLFLISTYGFAKALLSLNSSSDEKLVQSFSAFIADGWVASIFFLLQAVLLFDLTSNTTGTSNGSVAFVVVAALIVAIILLIATNIPMVKLFDGKDSSILVTRLAWGFGTTLIVMGLLALCEGDLDFGKAVFEEYLGRDAGAGRPFEVAVELIDLAPIKKQLPIPKMVDVIHRPVFVGGDMHIGDVGFAVADIDVGIGKRGVPRP